MVEEKYNYIFSGLSMFWDGFCIQLMTQRQCSICKPATTICMYCSHPHPHTHPHTHTHTHTGTGTFGRVVLARDIPTGQFYALKIMTISEVIRLRQVEHVNSERSILAMISHPFIVNMYVYQCHCTHNRPTGS